MPKRKMDPLCRTLTRGVADIDTFARMWTRSRETDNETMAAVCKARGKTFAVPTYETQGKGGIELLNIRGKSITTPALGPFTAEAYVEPKEKNTCERYGAKLIGTVHTHPWMGGVGRYFSTPDLTDLMPGEKHVCLVYRDEKSKALHLKCTTRKKNYDQRVSDQAAAVDEWEMTGVVKGVDPEWNWFDPEEDPKFTQYFTEPCDVKLKLGKYSSKKTKSRKMPWRSF